MAATLWVVGEVADGHLACANARFVDPLLEACLDVAGRTR